MKKITLFSAMLVVVLAGNAQSLTVNSTGCDAEFTIYAVDPSTCTVLETSNVQFVPGGGSITYSYSDFTTMPNLVWSSGNAPLGAFEIGYIEVFTPTACPTIGGGGGGSCPVPDFTTVGDVNCGYSNANSYLNTAHVSCMNCFAGVCISVNYNGAGTWGSGMNVNLQIQ